MKVRQGYNRGPNKNRRKGGQGMDGKYWMALMMEETFLTKLLETNEKTQKFGLTLSKEDAQYLMEQRKEALEETKRVEFGEVILSKIVYEFCDSDYIVQSEYVETLKRLQEIFFHFKNEMLDEVSDDELLHFMKEQFETVCRGDLEYLEGTCLSLFAQAVRHGYKEYKTRDGRGVFRELDEVKHWDEELYQETLKDLCWR